MMVNEEIITFQLDSEASVNLLSDRHILERKSEGSLTKTLVTWNGTEMKPLGECNIKLRKKQKVVCCEFCNCERLLASTPRHNSHTKIGDVSVGMKRSSRWGLEFHQK